MIEIKLNKTAEHRVKQFLRKLVGTHKNCKIVTSEIGFDIVKNHPPTLEGLPYSYNFHGAKWTTFSNKRTVRYMCSYIKSTQRIEIGINSLNILKFLMKKKSKSDYKLIIADRIINLPNLEVGRFLIKSYQDKNLKIIR